MALLEVLFISKDDFRRQILVYWINLLFTPCACTECLVERWPAKVRRYEQIQLSTRRVVGSARGVGCKSDVKRMLQQSARCSGLSVAQIEVALDSSAALESRRGALEAMPILRGSGSAMGGLAAC